MNRAHSDLPAAVVQGASRGIGLALTRLLLRDAEVGTVVATCRRPERAEVLHELGSKVGRRLKVVALDVTEESSIIDAVAATRAIARTVGMLVNCAGLLHGEDIKPERRLADIDAATLQRLFAVNAVGPLLVAKHFSALFDRNAPTIVANVSARVGSIGDNALGGWYGYRASKAAQNMFTRTLSIELQRRHRGIVCVALHPGTVDTGLSKPFQRAVRRGRLFSPEVAARNLLDVLARLSPRDNGQFFAWDGTRIPW